uniref:Rapid alkalinization factor 1 n=1 Tax=Leersia perrieri TaxID=77586 RepID=A0A0D9VTX3_9ORYZ
MARPALPFVVVLVVAVAAAATTPELVVHDRWPMREGGDPCLHGTVRECLADEYGGGGGGMRRRRLFQLMEEDDYYGGGGDGTTPPAQYISYAALMRNSVPCSLPGASYYNCRPGADANPYTRGCSAITQCRD